MRPGVALRLGRVSNLPTVWTNAAAGAALAGGAPGASVALAAASLSATYVGGMWLNDACDAEIDARERPGRPIPSGEAARRTVYLGGFALLGLGVALAATLGGAATVLGVALAATVTLYDWLHKRTALAPAIMGATRFLAYGLGVLAAGGWTGAALAGALGLFAHIVGLTYAARQEAYDRIERLWPLAVLAAPVLVLVGGSVAAPAALPLALAFVAALAWALRRLFRRAPGDVPRAVVMMIAAISLYDAALIATTGALVSAGLAAGCFVLTLALQRAAPGT